MPDENNEVNCIARAIEGDVEAFSDLYNRYVTRIYNYIYYRTGNAFDAEDITSKVFYRAFRHMRTYKEKGVPFSAWLYRIAHNLVANWHRDNSRKKEISLDEYHQSPDNNDYPENVLEDDQERDYLIKAIRKLPAERQHLLILKYVEHLSNVEIAVIMGRSEGAVKSLYHRTLLSLREKLLAQGTFIQEGDAEWE